LNHKPWALLSILLTKVDGSVIWASLRL